MRHITQYAYIAISCIMTIAISDCIAQNKRSGNDFSYENCGCSGAVDLRIFNGLYHPFGGQEIPEHAEISHGAVTVANLNDTDGDGDTNGDGIADVLDKDNNEVTVSATGRDEVDLMKVIVEATGTFGPTCLRFNLSTSTNLKLWKLATKELEYLQLDSIPLSNLPDTFFVEAIDHSTAVRDMWIKIDVKDESTGVMASADTALITAIWFEDPVVKHKTRATSGSNNASPNSLDLDQINLAHHINNISIALDGSRYGFGTFGKLPSLPEDGGVGGRILFQARMLPNGIENELIRLGIRFDFGRRKQVEKWTRSYSSSKLSYSIDSFPEQIELSNDDGISNNDEDLIPFPGNNDIFSFDTPANVDTHLSGSSYFSQPHSFLKRAIDFQEYVRVSFMNEILGDSILGSACSNFVPWDLSYSLVNQVRDTTKDLYNSVNTVLQLMVSDSAIYAQPRRLTGTGDGKINITLLSGISSSLYLFKFIEPTQEWEITRRNSGGSVILGKFSSSNSIWNMVDMGKVEFVFEENPSIKYSNGTIFSIAFIKETGFVVNELN